MLVDADRIAQYTARGWWGIRTLDDLFREGVARHPEREAVADAPNRAALTDGAPRRLTWAQLGLHHKPCGILNIKGYFDYFLKMLDHAADEEFLKPEHRKMVLSATDPSVLLDRLQAYQPPGAGEKWITSDQV